MGPKNVPSEGRAISSGKGGEAVRTKSCTRVGTYAQERGDRGSAHIQGDPDRYIRGNVTCFCSYASNLLSLFSCQYFGNFSGSPCFDKKTFGLPVAGQVPKRK